MSIKVRGKITINIRGEVKIVTYILKIYNNKLNSLSIYI